MDLETHGRVPSDVPANPEKHQWAPRPVMVAPEARCEDPVPRLRGGTLITVGSEGCAGVPQGADGKAFPGRGYNGTGLKCTQEDGNRICSYLVTTRPSASCEWSRSTRWLNLTAQREKERTEPFSSENSGLCRHPVSSGQAWRSAQSSHQKAPRHRVEVRGRGSQPGPDSSATAPCGSH